VARLEREGFTTELAALGDLAAPALEELEVVSLSWRGSAPERGFSMALDALDAARHPDSVVLVARDRDGRARGFLQLVPCYGRRAMSLAAMRREREATNGLTEFMIVRAIELLRERGVDELSLNFAVLGRLLHRPEGRVERLLGALGRRASTRFQIESLYRFNAKFFPRWEPRYLLYEGALGLPRAPLAALWAEGQIPRMRLGRAPA
jgi:lysyl-tRNA synthetase class 2